MTRRSFSTPHGLVEDSLLKPNILTHHSEAVLEDEELSPSLENFVVLTWLRLVDPELPKLIKQHYGTELRTHTLASLKPEISQALDSLLDELKCANEAKVMRTASSSFTQSPHRLPYQTPPKAPLRQRSRDKSCPLCKQAGRTSTGHFLSECKFLPPEDRRFMLKARQIVAVLDGDTSDAMTKPDPPDNEGVPPNPPPRRPYLTRLA